MATSPSSSPPVSPMATSPSSSRPVGTMFASSSSPTLVPAKEYPADLRTRRRLRQRRRRTGDERRSRKEVGLSETPLRLLHPPPYAVMHPPESRRTQQRTTPPPVDLGSVEGLGPYEGMHQPESPVGLESVEGRHQPKERKTLLATPPPVKISYVKAKDRRPKDRRPPSLCHPVDQVGGRFSPLVDLPCEEKSSSDEVPKPWDTNHVLAWGDPNLPTPVYVRMDRSGVYHTYPALRGPFQSLDEVQSAVVSYADGSSIGMSKKLLRKDRVVRERLFWPDGTSRICTRVQVAKREDENVNRLVKALLDKKNDDEGRADELKDIVHWQSICERHREWYYHLNITVKTKGAADDAGSATLFFAEVARDQNDVLGYYINTFSRVKTDSKDDEAICHGCMNNGSTDMKHPPANSFKGGHADIRFPIGFGPCNEKKWRVSRNTKAQDKKLIETEEKRIRERFNYLDNDVFLENCRNKRLNFRSWESDLARRILNLPANTEE